MGISEIINTVEDNTDREDLQKRFKDISAESATSVSEFKQKTIACVTGASGMIGWRVVQRLLSEGYGVRVLSRGATYRDSRAEHFRGDLRDENIVSAFVSGAHMLFHCAAEMNDCQLMWEVNVKRTERLLRIIKGEDMRYLCYISSAGVVGRTKEKWVDEETLCDPQNVYEKSKWMAEQLVVKGISGCSVVILRPTNVIDEDRIGTLALPVKHSWIDILKVLFKGSECAHLVHADDVADAAIHFISRPVIRPHCYFVSCDHEPLNTVAGLWYLYRAYKNKRVQGKMRQIPHLPLIIPHILRKLVRGSGNRGDVRYSSAKLMSTGFTYRIGVKEAVRRVVCRYEMHPIN